MSSSDLYVYRARVVPPPYDPDASGVWDGDTWWLHIDKGFDHGFRDRFRAKTFDTPEVTGSAASEYEKQKGDEARVAAEEWFVLSPFLVRTFKASKAHFVEDRGRYGRWLAEPFRIGEDGNEEHLADHLIGMGLATFWPTRWREVHGTEDGEQDS